MGRREKLAYSLRDGPSNAFRPASFRSECWCLLCLVHTAESHGDLALPGKAGPQACREGDRKIVNPSLQRLESGPSWVELVLGSLRWWYAYRIWREMG